MRAGSRNLKASSIEAEKIGGPFSGLLVIDLTHVLNGPCGTTILSDLGARIIKIELPDHGDDARIYGPLQGVQPYYFSFVNRGKASILLNLRDQADKAIFPSIIRHADLLTDSFRPGEMEHLGFSYEH
jgi:CoA:oxalate CoA-transferase